MPSLANIGRHDKVDDEIGDGSVGCTRIGL